MLFDCCLPPDIEYENIKQQIIAHEGLRLDLYFCPARRITIGVGRNLQEKGISEEEAMFLLRNDIYECLYDLIVIFPEFLSFSPARQTALIDLRLNLGPKGFRSFKRMIEAIKADDWAVAAEELKDSRWWTQVQDERKNTLYNQLKGE